MDFRLELFLLTLIFSCFSKCHSWIQKYPYTSVFTVSDHFNTIGYSWDFPTAIEDLAYGYQHVPLQEDTILVYKKILENQLRAYSIISELESNIPCELRSSRNSFCQNEFPKVYFADYPHVKALLQYQWKRLKHPLDSSRLGSLRVDSPFYRP